VWAPALSAADFALFLQGLLGSHQLRVRVQILDIAQKVLGDVSDQLLDGSVTVDATADITRQASVSLLDPGHVLQLDSGAPSDGVLYADRMIGISYQIYSEAFPQTVTIPIFTGPVAGVDRDDRTVVVSALGKEVLAQRPAWRTRSYSKGWYRTQIVKDLLAETGETRFDIEAWTLRTADVFSVSFETNVWALAKKMAGDRLLYYNGAGTLVMRKALTRTVFTFRDGNGGSLLTKPRIGHSTDDLRNIIRVKGGIPKGAKYPVQYTAYAPASHPLSAQSLGRNGKARHLVEIIEDTDLLSVKDCKERAESALKSALKTATAVTFDARPVPMMEWGDLIGTSAAGVSSSSRLDQFTLPLRAGESASMGYNDRRATVVKANIRRKR
jgi:hypothetical protein